jgi:hypothetical protein
MIGVGDLLKEMEDSDLKFGLKLVSEKKNLMGSGTQIREETGRGNTFKTIKVGHSGGIQMEDCDPRGKEKKNIGVDIVRRLVKQIISIEGRFTTCN